MNQSPILISGKNCWRIEHADRASMLVDGADYFHAFRETAKNARQSILLIGWDIDSRFELERESVDDGLPVALGKFLKAIAERRQELNIHVLDWDFAIIYTPDREWLPRYKMDWTGHRRLHFRLDNRHPTGASHHQKIVVIDDRVAFVGGLDFTLGRWDTSAHRPDDPLRRDLNSTIPQPYHDVQLMVSGPVAGALGELARERWRHGTGSDIPDPSGLLDHDPWPADIMPDFRQAKTGIARTRPEFGNRPAVAEIERLLIDAIAHARKVIYIENQYFTAQVIGDALEKKLREENGPEIVVVLPEKTVGWLSQHTMDVLRERLLRKLCDADRHGRLRVYCPYVPGLDNSCINVHAKVMIIDDVLLRVGSANFNNRSMGLDTECDLAIEADDDPRLRDGIAAQRNRLLAEHLDITPSAVAAGIAEYRSIIGAIENLRGGGRTLKPFEFQVSEELDALVPDARLADPKAPVDAERLARQFIEEEDKPVTRRTLLTLTGIVVAALLLAAGWRWTPLGEWLDIRAALNDIAALRGSVLAVLVVPIVYILSGLVIFPVTLVIVATGVAFGGFYGFFYALLGAELSAIVTYAIGRSLGRDTIQRLSNRWAGRVSRRLARQGLLAIITLRVVPVAPFSVINLIAGASHIRFHDFALGTLLGIAPGILALTLFSDQVVTAIQAPETVRIISLLIMAAVIGTGAWALSRWLLKRRDAHGQS